MAYAQTLVGPGRRPVQSGLPGRAGRWGRLPLSPSRPIRHCSTGRTKAPLRGKPPSAASVADGSPSCSGRGASSGA